MTRVGIVGASGFLGSELVRLVHAHPDLQLAMVTGNNSAGKRLADLRPGFASLGSLLVRPSNPDELANGCDVVFLALPHGESSGMAAALVDLGTLAIDLGSDFRLRDPADHHVYYNRAAPDRRYLDVSTYCLPELTGPPASDAKIIACPGCFATALSMTLAAISDLTDSVQVFGVTGSSGSGIAPSGGVHHSLRSTNFVAYKPLAHQHEGEVKQVLADLEADVSFDFVPHSAPVTRGIHLTTVVPASPQDVELTLQRYEECPFVVVEPGPAPLGSVIGTNLVRFGYAGQGDKTAVFCAIDNLLKGGAGQAVQILNLVLGLPQTQGLPTIPLWP